MRLTFSLEALTTSARFFAGLTSWQSSALTTTVNPSTIPAQQNSSTGAILGLAADESDANLQ